MLVLMVAVCAALPSLLVSAQTTPAADLCHVDWRPCGDFPWDTDDVTVSCDYTYTDVKQWDAYDWYSSSEPPLVLHGRCTVTCPSEANMLVGPPHSASPGYHVNDGAYYCNVGNSTWMGSEPVCLGHFNSSTVITDDTNSVRLVGGEFYGCVELYDDVTGQWGPVRGWDVDYWSSKFEDRMSWVDLACRNIGLGEGLATSAYELTNGVVSSYYPELLQWYYRLSYPSTVPKFMVSQSLPQWEDHTPCGDFPWDTDDVTVSCGYNYSDVWHWPSVNGSPTEAPTVLQGRCTVACPPEADMLVGPPLYSAGYSMNDGAYYCNVGNSTWMGTEPVCLGHYNTSIVITDDTNRTRLVGGDFYGCVELYDDVTGQWGNARGWEPWEYGIHYEARMSWADLVCKNLGFREGLATGAYELSNGVVSGSYPWAVSLQDHYSPSYPSTVPKFVVSQSLPQWEGATLHDAIDHVDRGSGSNWGSMCLACAGERTQDIAAQVTCTSDHLEVSFPRPPDNSVQAADVQLAAPPCRAEQNSTHIYIRTALGECGTAKEQAGFSQNGPLKLLLPCVTFLVRTIYLYTIFLYIKSCPLFPTPTTPTEMIYRNTLTVGADPSHGGITWQQLTKVPLECRLPRNKTLSLDFRPHLKSVFRSGVEGEGEFRISMELFRTDGFRQPVTEYPVFVELQEVSPEYPVLVALHQFSPECPVFVELQQMIHVQIQVNSSDADLQVFPRTCVATPSDDPSDKTRNDVIVDGCAKLPTLQFYPSPGPDRGRFGFQAFAYTSGAPTVYLHCDVLLCKASDPNSRCAQGCQTPSGRRRREAEGEPEVYRLIQGPIVLGDDQTGRKSLDLFTVSGIMGACALLLAAAMFVLGVLYKARREGRQSGYRVLENTDLCAVLPLVSGWTTPPVDWRPCGDFPWDTDDVTVDCDYSYSSSSYYNHRHGRCTVTCPREAVMLVGPPSLRSYFHQDGDYYCNVRNTTWMGSEPVCLGSYNSSTVITDDTNGIRLRGGEFYGCVEMYDDVTGQWGPVRGWDVKWSGSQNDARMSWADLACRDLGFREGLATHAYPLRNGGVSNSLPEPIQRHYYYSHPSTVPKFIVSQSLPRWEGATLHDAIDRVERGDYCLTNDRTCSKDYMCLACAGERTHNVNGTTRCGPFPWDNDDITVDCDYNYTDVMGPVNQQARQYWWTTESPWYMTTDDPWYVTTEAPSVPVQGRCTVTCPRDADMLVGPQPSGDGAYYCNLGNNTWTGSEPRCLARFNSSVVITDDTNTVRLVGGEFYGCVEMYDDVTRQWRLVGGWDAEGGHHEDRMSWADLVCKNLGFREGLATHAYPLTNGVVSRSHPYSLQHQYRGPFYLDSNGNEFKVSQSLPQWEGATLHDAVDWESRGGCWAIASDNECVYMCLACAGDQNMGSYRSHHVTCTSDHLEVSFPRPPDNSVQAADVQLAAPPCRAEQNSTHIYIRTHFEKCGTSTQTTPSELIYRNTLTVGADPSSGGITWDRLPKILLECRLPRNKTLSLHFRPHLKSVFRSDVQGEGEFEISMQLFRTDKFWQPVTEYPVYVDLRQVIHVQIQVNSNGTDLQVFPHTCVATPSDDPSDRTRNDVIVDGCAKLPTLQFYPSPSPDRGRFGFQAFAYTSGAPTVYLHCDVLLCKASDPNSRCAQGCQTPSGRRRREAEGEPEVYRLIQGPIVLGDDQTGEHKNHFSFYPNSGRQDLVTASSILGACAVLAAAMFVLGVLYKARREGRQSGYRVLENAE
ncbi:PREDICTED: LOW QUALITY PROTEIN: uncharacterized protein LOC109465776 [Branchiostoma belcheri]|uniref:LOW QUALITY PROTEIN: uncharacterized protein LOC109465776 n=1 Tax=Branchiostoma belcheri TaxID=7741 RepID=A0A6P4Y8Z5_BRABE|nr:PREDICTED: LOW QUALITY PROTEIN: uncharacterized protein LOC109465776 [Branchiostoma belcheri]